MRPIAFRAVNSDKFDPSRIAQLGATFCPLACPKLAAETDEIADLGAV